MKHKSLLLVTVLAVMALTVGGMEVAVNASTPASNYERSNSDGRDFLVPGGEAEDKPEFGEVSEYEDWMKQERAYYQGLADSGDKLFWYKNDNDVYACREWTQKDVDALYSKWQEQLDLMKQGHRFTKTITLPDGGLLSGEFGPEANAPPVSAPGSTIITLPDGSTMDLGHFDTAEEATQAVEQYLTQRVKDGLLTPAEADKILAHGNIE